MATSTLAMLALLTASQAPHPPIEPKLTEIIDHRVVTVVTDDDGFNFNPPGLNLAFDLDLRPGFQFAAFDHEHVKIEARDSVGTDLTKIESGFGQPQHFEVIGTWGEEGMVYDSFTLKLGKARRDATTFSVHATVPAIVFAGIEVHNVRVASKASDLPGSKFGQDARIQMRAESGMVTVTIRPGTLKDSIEKLELVARDGEPVESISTMWNDQSVQYMFQVETEASAQVLISHRKNVHSVPVRVEIKDRPLP